MQKIVAVAGSSGGGDSRAKCTCHVLVFVLMGGAVLGGAFLGDAVVGGVPAQNTALATKPEVRVVESCRLVRQPNCIIHVSGSFTGVRARVHAATSFGRAREAERQEYVNQVVCWLRCVA